MSTDDKCPHGIELTAECLDCNETAHAKNYAQLGMRPETRGLALQVLGLLARLKAEREESKRWEASSQEHAQLKEEREGELARHKASAAAVLDEHRRNWCIEVTALHKERDEADETIEKLRSQLAAKDAEIERLKTWRPIDTAPKDGTQILACAFYLGRSDLGASPRTVQWTSFHPNAPGKAAWRNMFGHKEEWLTHWMPRPEPPSEESQS